MFTVNEYKIVFKRRWHMRTSDYGNGRYDTVCEIYIKDLEVPRFTGVAKLHPNDQVNRVIGKKIALRKAIGTRKVAPTGRIYWVYNCDDFYNKSVRTAIWKAFRNWVSQWPNQVLEGE